MIKNAILRIDVLFSILTVFCFSINGFSQNIKVPISVFKNGSQMDIKKAKLFVLLNGSIDEVSIAGDSLLLIKPFIDTTLSLLFKYGKHGFYFYEIDTKNFHSLKFVIEKRPFIYVRKKFFSNGIKRYIGTFYYLEFGNGAMTMVPPSNYKKVGKKKFVKYIGRVPTD